MSTVRGWEIPFVFAHAMRSLTRPSVPGPSVPGPTLLDVKAKPARSNGVQYVMRFK